jgi:RNA polymerase sigma-70 factor (ECF subfamily)
VTGHPEGVTSGEADRRARFDVLAREAYAPLRRYLARRTGPASLDDVLSDTLLVMWRRVDDIPADAALPWCYGVARRCLANARRADQRQAGLLRRLVAQPDRRPELVWAETGDDGKQALGAALAGLSGTDREVLRLWAWEQLEPREMAVVLGITPNAASIRLHRATGRLRRQLTPLAAAARKDADPAGHLALRQEGPFEDRETPR